MGDFPNSDEEFELMYGDELQMLDDREEEEVINLIPKPPSRKSLNFSTPKHKQQQQSQNPQPCSSKSLDIACCSKSLDTELENSFDRDFRRLDDSVNNKKRCVEDLFGDIDDLILEEEQRSLAKKPKTEDQKLQEDLHLIDVIIQMRKEASEKLNPNLSLNQSRSGNSYDHIKNNISASVPRYPFIGVTRHDGERIYVRMHSEQYEKEDIVRITSDNSYKGLIGAQSKELWAQANQIINKQLDDPTISNPSEISETDTSKLWVDLYKPRKYTELLSDESTNRTLLKWLKLWDKVVFHRRPKISKKKTPQFPSKFPRKELDTTLDEHDRPQYKVALLCGPPGLGKTTLAHMVARHCGYNVVEINASDDRNVDKFKQALENATQMKSVIDREGRPNCLVFDEIDGAPSASIDFLIKFIQGNTKNKKGKKQKFILKRPIICICNDVYVPALRPLRQISFILNFPPTNATRLGERLMEISRHQHIKTDLGVMINLSEKTNNDIRACLSVLTFFKAKNLPVTLSEIQKTNVGLKDMQKGLFTVWSDIFEVKKDATLTERMGEVLNSVITFGDYDRLTQGIFENYPLVKHKGTALNPICAALEWFSYTDFLGKKIQESQNYSLSSYLPYGFVVWHYAFASYTKKKINYPTASYEVSNRLNTLTSTLSFLLSSISPFLRCYTSRLSLLLDTIPMLLDILAPSLRTVNISLYAPDEKSQISHVVDIMIDYSLTYVQEKGEEGYGFKMEPDLEEIALFKRLKNNRRTLSYTSRQMLAREIEMEKMRRLERTLYKNSDNVNTESTSKDNSVQIVEEKCKNSEKKIENNKNKNKENENVNQPALPNHLQRLKAKCIKPKEVIVKDFFGRVVTKPAKPKFGDNSEQSFAGDIWYQFKEGYSNAVRRRVKIENLLND